MDTFHYSASRRSSAAPLPNVEPNTHPAVAGKALTDLREMLASLSPTCRPGIWVYAMLPEGMPVPECAAAVVAEAEGATVVLREEDAHALGLKALFRGSWITLRVHSSLDAVGLMARIATELAHKGIPCNVLAGFCHDHLLVPVDRTADTLACLSRLERCGKIAAQ